MKRERTPVRLFITAAAADAAFQTELEKHVYPLWQQGLLENWQSVQPGEQVEEVFVQAKLILLLLSADFSTDRVCQEHMQRALERQREGKVQVLPILVRPVEVTNAPFAHLAMVPTNRQAVTQWTNQDAAWMHIAEAIRCLLEGKPLPPVGTAKEAVSAPAAEKRVWMVPYARNPFFTGRDEVLDELHERCKGGQAQAVSQPQAMSGLGGIGKTQLAVGYAYRYREHYQQVLWASAETVELLNTAYTQIAVRLDLPEKGVQEQEVIVEAVKGWLAEHEGWLLVLDNADEPEVLEAFLPPMVGGQVVVTTRASDLTTLGRGFGHALEVETFTPEQGALFLLHRAGVLMLDVAVDQAKGEDRHRAMELSEELGGLPLALDQAGAYIAQTRCTLMSYLHRYQTHRRRLLKERRGKEHPDPVATTWKLSFERVAAASVAAAELLRLCGFLAPDAIPEGMVQAGAASLGSILAPLADGYLLDEAIEMLRGYSLLKRDGQTGMLRVHRLVQTVVRDAMTEEEERAWKQRVMVFLSEVCPDVSDVEQWPLCEQWVPHAVVSTTWLEDVSLWTEAAALVCNEAGSYLFERGWYSLAEPLYQRALEIREQELGPRHPHTAVSLNNLAGLYQAQGKYTEAEPLCRRALEIREQALGPRHPETAQSVNNLAALYQDQGRYGEAEPLYTRVLAIREQALGPGHPDTARSVNNLALLYNAQGRYGEAEPLSTRALEIREQSLGPGHPDTATSLNNLAELYQAQGKYALAEPLSTRALAINSEVYGADHPEVATDMNNLAELYRVQGKSSEAEPLMKRALEIREQALGPRHPDTAASLNNLAGLYQEQGRYGEAEPLYQRALEIWEQELGPGHPDTAASLNNLASLYQAQGKYTEAEPLCRRALEIREQELGPRHPDTAVSLNNLAGLYQAQGRYGEAEPLYQRALEIREQELGPRHPDTVVSLNNLAALYQEQGKYAEAEPLFESVLEIREQSLGGEHPGTATTLAWLAVVAQQQQRYAEALGWYARAWGIYKRVLGVKHPTTSNLLEYYAGLLRELGREEEAAALEAEGD